MIICINYFHQCILPCGQFWQCTCVPLGHFGISSNFTN